MNDRSHFMSVIDDPMEGFNNMIGTNGYSAMLGPHTMIGGSKSRRHAAKHGFTGLSVGG